LPRFATEFAADYERSDACHPGPCLSAVNCGFIPSPAVALYGITREIPSIMVTGSHIPDDRNGIKFNQCNGRF
jgi:hypothetical protein